MCFVNCRESQQIIGIILINEEIFPERTRFNDRCSINKKWEKTLKIETLFMERLIIKTHFVQRALSSIKKFNIWQLDSLRLKFFLFFKQLGELNRIFVDSSIVLFKLLLNIVNVCKCWRLLLIINLNEGNQTLFWQSEVYTQTLVTTDALFIPKEL